MRAACGPAGRDAGFTLLELLAATVVLGLVISMLTQGLHFGLLATRLTSGERGREQGQDLLAGDQALRRLIQRADPGTYPDPAPLRGTADVLSLTTELPSAAGPTLRADAELLAASGRLVMRWRQHRHAEAFGPGPAWQEATLADGVERVIFAYQGRGSSGWFPGWKGERLPTLVQVQLVFAEGSGLRWPPIVVAPLRRPIEE
jgi:prepilin-type N-terminal cleavage/methylation domain-containing protein